MAVGRGERDVTVGLRTEPKSDHMRVALWLADSGKRYTFARTSARYQPAKTKTGESVASIGFQRIRWEIP